MTDDTPTETESLARRDSTSLAVPETFTALVALSAQGPTTYEGLPATLAKRREAELAIRPKLAALTDEYMKKMEKAAEQRELLSKDPAACPYCGLPRQPNRDYKAKNDTDYAPVYVHPWIEHAHCVREQKKQNEQPDRVDQFEQAEEKLRSDAQRVAVAGLSSKHLREVLDGIEDREFRKAVIAEFDVAYERERAERLQHFPTIDRVCTNCYAVLDHEHIGKIDRVADEGLETQTCSPECSRAIERMGFTWGNACEWCGRWFTLPGFPEDARAPGYCGPYCMFSDLEHSPFDDKDVQGWLQHWPLVMYLPPPPTDSAGKRKKKMADPGPAEEVGTRWTADGVDITWRTKELPGWARWLGLFPHRMHAPSLSLTTETFFSRGEAEIKESLRRFGPASARGLVERGLPKATVYRVLPKLAAKSVIEKTGDTFFLAAGPPSEKSLSSSY
jgi:hypothetical protein